MFGNKLRSWMEAVRPKKKQHRKDKQLKCNNIENIGQDKRKAPLNTEILQKHFKDHKTETETIVKNESNQNRSSVPGVSNSNSRYSANNLSSPESAYSTGYSTDGTSPVTGIHLDYLHINHSRKPTEKQYYEDYIKSTPLPTSICTVEPSNVLPAPTPPKSTENEISNSTISLQNQEWDESTNRFISQAQPVTLRSSGSPCLGVTSPRQRNRIRTNPWLPNGATSPALARQEIPKTSVSSPRNTNSSSDNSKTRRFLSPVLRRRSLSSSSCSSLSGTSLHWEPAKRISVKSVSDEDDCTLNEMMGKYDESYVYEKETDILSDSDPTDCETDIDTGQDGGDEGDPIDVELEFIDNESYLDFETKFDYNTGHCSYYNFEHQRRSSRRRPTKRSNHASEKKRKASSNKKRHKQNNDRDNNRRCLNMHLDGSKSAGVTPVSVRRAPQAPVSQLALEHCLKKRSNSLSFGNNFIVTNTIDKRDKEAGLKYKELIDEAETILQTIKCSNGVSLSPRRLPGPANKRVELLRHTECTKPDLFVKSRAAPTENVNVLTNNSNTFYTKTPSNNYNCPRFSPKKNHITNFIISNSPILMRREWEMQQTSNAFSSPLTVRTESQQPNLQYKSSMSHTESSTKTNEHRNSRINSRSPKYRKKSTKNYYKNNSTSSDSDNDNKPGNRKFNCKLENVCPQSEPARRKVYFGLGHNKTVAFNLNHDKNYSNFDKVDRPHTNSNENLRQQVLLNTIANLKRDLEYQSASLKQVYRSSQNIHL